MTALGAYFLTSLVVLVFFGMISSHLRESDPPDWALVPIMTIFCIALVSAPFSLILIIWSNVK